MSSRAQSTKIIVDDDFEALQVLSEFAEKHSAFIYSAYYQADTNTITIHYLKDMESYDINNIIDDLKNKIYTNSRLEVEINLNQVLTLLESLGREYPYFMFNFVGFDNMSNTLTFESIVKWNTWTFL